jgi:hypothetical protein
VLPQNTNLFAYIDDTDDDDTENTISTQNAEAESSLASFTLFPELPVELRLVIWEMMLPSRRYVEIESTILFVEENPQMQDYDVKTWHPVGIERAPVGFFVCRESRAEILKTYAPLRSTDGQPTLFVDFKKDVLCFSWWRFHLSIGQFFRNLPDNKLVDSLGYLLVDEEADGNGDGVPGGHNFWINREILGLKGLKEILLIPHCHRKQSRRRIVDFKECGTNSPAAKHSLKMIKETFEGLEPSNPGWKRPKARYGRVLLGELLDL